MEWNEAQLLEMYNTLLVYARMASSDDDELESTVAKKISRLYCPRKETLSYKTFRTHKRLYYDAVQSVWRSIPFI